MNRDQTVKVHYCFKQHLGEQLNPEKCNCRKWITFEEAEQTVADGRADWLILSRTKVAGPHEIGKFNPERGRFNPPTRVVSDKNFVRMCPRCSRLSELKRKVPATCSKCRQDNPEVYWEELACHQLPIPGGTIVMISQADEKGRFGLALHKRTPRVATVEKQHIIRAVVEGHRQAQQRIEEYDLINLLELYGKPQGGHDELCRPVEKKIEFTLEPEDRYAKFDGKTKKWDLPDDQGRRYDYGRAIIW